MSSSDASEQAAQRQIVETFRKLREQQKEFVQEAARVEDEKREFSRVLKLLEEMDGSRKCFRLINDTLVEYTVSNVIPTLKKNEENLQKICDNLNEQVVEKGKELNAFKEKHNIRFLTDKETAELRAAQLKQLQLQQAEGK